MPRPSPALKNLTLTGASVLAVILVTLGADRLLGSRLAPPPLPGSMELIFPPGSVHEHETVDFRCVERINNLGLRERDMAPEHSGAFRILAIGDSYTYGWGVDAEETWLRALENELNGKGYEIETINMGKPGAGPTEYVEFAETGIPLFQPDLVIVAMLQGNDLSAAGEEPAFEPRAAIAGWMRALYPNTMRWLRDMRRGRDFSGRTEEIAPPQRSSAEDNRRWKENRARSFYEHDWSAEQRAYFDALDEEVRDAFLSGRLNPYLVDLAMQNARFYTATFDLDDPWTQTCIRRAGARLARIADVAREYGTPVLVVSIPEGAYVNDEAWENMRRNGYDIPEDVLESDAPDEGIRRACAVAGVPFLNATETFREHRNDPALFYRLDGHLTAKGHALYAGALAPRLEEAYAELLAENRK